MTWRDEESFHMVLPMTGGFRESLVTLAILTPCLDVSMHCYPLSPGLWLVVRPFGLTYPAFDWLLVIQRLILVSVPHALLIAG